jgi:hypothetical protein
MTVSVTPVSPYLSTYKVQRNTPSTQKRNATSFFHSEDERQTKINIQNRIINVCEKADLGNRQELIGKLLASFGENYRDNILPRDNQHHGQLTSRALKSELKKLESHKLLNVSCFYDRSHGLSKVLTLDKTQNANLRFAIAAVITFLGDHKFDDSSGSTVRIDTFQKEAICNTAGTREAVTPYLTELPVETIKQHVEFYKVQVKKYTTSELVKLLNAHVDEAKGKYTYEGFTQLQAKVDSLKVRVLGSEYVSDGYKVSLNKAIDTEYNKFKIEKKEEHATAEKKWNSYDGWMKFGRQLFNVTSTFIAKVSLGYINLGTYSK